MRTLKVMIVSILILILFFTGLLFSFADYVPEWSKTLIGIVGFAAAFFILIFTIYTNEAWFDTVKELKADREKYRQNVKESEEILKIISNHEAVKLFKAAKKEKDANEPKK